MKAMIAFPNKSFLAKFAIVVFILMGPFLALAETNDFQSANSHYDQYSPANLNSDLNSQYSPTSLDNPFSMQKEVSTATVLVPAQEEHDYRVGYVNPPGKVKSKISKKTSPEEAYLLTLLKKEAPHKGLPLVFPLVFFSLIAIAATALIIIGIFKK